jgi:lipid-A-disaccharide synthase
MPSICLVVGDPSGDAHAARLIEALKQQSPTLSFTGLGGPAMRQAGASLLDELTTTAAIGPFDAARHLPRFVRARRLLKELFEAQRPDLVLLVDFGDYNLPVVAPLAKRYGLPVLYYISPQLWAWGRWRLRYVRRYVDRMIVFFPFEETFYQREGIPVTCVGHPLIEQARPRFGRDEARTRFGLNLSRMTVGLLPGSRADEVRRHLPLLLAAARQVAWRMPGVQFLVPRATSVSRQLLEAICAKAPIAVCLAEGPAADALQLMEAAIVTSGTATLECAIAGVPMVVVYRASWPTYLAARLVLRIPHIAMVNVVAGGAIVPELVQHQARPRRIAATLLPLLRDAERRATMQAALREVTTRLGGPGAVGRSARAVLEHLNTHNSGR